MVRARNPRGQHGGVRQGAPGANYQNRSDLTQAPRAVPGQTYGVAGQQIAAQQAVPLPLQGVPGAAAPATVSGGGAPLPPPIDSPTQRPGEPITAGLATGPGPGPEALIPPDPLVKAAAVLNLLGSSADPQTQQLRARVNAMVANQGAA